MTEYIEAAALNPSRGAKGPCVYTAAGIFILLNNLPVGIAECLFNTMRRKSFLGIPCAMKASQIIALLENHGIPMNIDIYLTSDGAGMAHEELACTLGNKATVHPFDMRSLRGEIQVTPGQCKMLFIDNNHVIAVARDSDGLCVFDTAMNSDRNFEPPERFLLNFSKKNFPWQFTADGKKYARGAHAELILDEYIDSIACQPIVISCKTS